MMSNEFSDSLRNNADKIIKLWHTRALEEVTVSLKRKSLALYNSLPEYLTQLMDALSSSIDRTPHRIEQDKVDSTRVGKKPGFESAHSVGHSIDQLITEYRILRQTIFEVLEEKKELPKIARDIIIDSIEQAVNDAASQFSETLRDFQEQLTATMTHDLRIPITAAKMSAQLILRRPEHIDSTIKFAGRIVESMDRIDKMIQDLLDSSRVRAGQKLELSFEKFDLDFLSTEVCQELTTLYGRTINAVSNGPVIGYWSRLGIRKY